MKDHPKIAIIYLQYYHNESFMDDAVSALRKVTYPKDKLAFVIVDNPEPEKGLFTHYIQETVMPHSGKDLPEVVYLPQETNLGFAGGNNKGVDWALEHGYDLVYFHNNDGFFARNAFEPLVDAFQKDEKLGIAQSLILLHPETDKINSTGNALHFLGFGYSNHCWEKIKDVELEHVYEIGYASGAAFMARADLTKQYGAWDHDFFLYHEDTEWSLRLRALGYKIVAVRDSIFYHKYQFARSIGKFYWMERNRIGVLLMFYRWPTLLLMLPMAIILEAGLIFTAIKGGWFKKRIEVYQYWLKPSSWKLWLGKRKKIQRMRTVSDRFLLSYTVSGIYFQDKSVDNPLLRYIGNPLMKLYQTVIIRGLIWW